MSIKHARVVKYFLLAANMLINHVIVLRSLLTAGGAQAWNSIVRPYTQGRKLGGLGRADMVIALND
jgi:hypothetical protein